MLLIICTLLDNLHFFKPSFFGEVCSNLLTILNGVVYEKIEREIKETILFTIATKRIKSLGTNLPKETKDLYIENYKTLMKEINDTNRWRNITMFMDQKNQYSENEYTTQSNLQIQCNPYQATSHIFHRTRTNNFTLCMEMQKPSNSQRNLEKEEWNWKTQPA